MINGVMKKKSFKKPWEQCKDHKPQVCARLRLETEKLLAKQQFCNVLMIIEDPS